MSFQSSVRSRPRLGAFALTAALAGAAVTTALPALAADGTTVGGVMSADTVWTPEGSPYRVTSTVQIPNGVTLTIQPGVSVVGAGAADLFQMHGNLVAEGTDAARIDFDGAGSANFFSGKGARVAVLRLRHTDVHDGRSLWPPSGDQQNAQWIVADSTFRNLSEYSYLWYPSADSVFERNVFSNSAGFSVGTDTRTRPGQVTFAHNRFVGDSRSGYWIRNWAAYGQPTLVTGNTFTAAGSPTLELRDGYDSAAMSAPSNYWSTTDTAVIDSMIADSRDSISRAGVINYDPLLTEPTAQTPAPPSSGTPSQSASPSPSSTACDPHYPDFCLPTSPDVDCSDPVVGGRKNFTALSPDPHNLDSDKDGVACETDASTPPSPAPSQSSPPAQQDAAPTLALNPSTISAGQATVVTYSGTPGSTVYILSRTQPSTVFTKIGSVTLDAQGTGTSTHRPMKNTRITARTAAGKLSDFAPIIAVKSVASFNANRVGTRTYNFTGRVYPALSNRLVNLYRNGVLVGQGRCDSTGIYSITKTLAAGTFTFQLRTPNDQDNLGTNSRELRLLIN